MRSKMKAKWQCTILQKKKKSCKVNAQWIRWYAYMPANASARKKIVCECRSGIRKEIRVIQSMKVKSRQNGKSTILQKKVM